ncbi:MAG: ATP-binding protein [bacterium]|nr:ATP-binding protein [bacterium]
MILDKRRLQRYTSLTLATLVLCLGLLSGWFAIDLFQSALERKMAEDSEIIGENLRIFIDQATQEYSDPEMPLARIQEVLEILKEKKWYGFACVVDTSGRVLAHPRPEFRGMQVPLESYEPTSLLGRDTPRVKDIRTLPDPGQTQVYRTRSDIIAIQWLPQIMTYLCVHQSLAPLRSQVDRLVTLLAAIGAVFVATAAAGSWFFVGRLVDRYESHLARSEARNRALVQNSAPILVVDNAGVILDANPQAASLFGAPQETLRTHNLKDLWLPRSRFNLNDLLRGDQVLEWPDLEMRTLQGKPLPVDLRACVIDYANREAVYLLLRDVTESRRARDEMLEANRQLRELDQLKTDFLNMVSHELRTPLTSIRWSAESLAALFRDQDNENVQKLLNIIREDNLRLSALVEQLLGFARLDAGKLKPRFQLVQVAPLLHSALAEMAPIAKKKDIALTRANLPDALSLDADPEQLRQVIINILDNAIKYTPSGGTVHLDCVPSGNDICIKIKDTGIGIPEKDLPRIFEKFYRTDHPAARKEKGTGLGLAIVQGIVAAHGGHLNVSSEVNKGSTFSIHLPATRSASS